MVRWGVLAVALCVAGGAEAGPFSVQADGTGTAWVVDEGSGALRVCRMTTRVSPKTMDVFGGGADSRPGMDRAARPDCRLAMRAVEEPPASPALGMLGVGLSGPQVGSAAGMLGSGAFGWGWGGAPDNQVIVIGGQQAVRIGLY